MDQIPLIHEDIFEAIKTTVQAMGGSKKVGHALWPEKSPAVAGELLNNCLNCTRPEKLGIDQLLFIAREGRKLGCHAVMDYIAGDGGYQYTPIEPKDEVAELQRRYIDAAKSIQAISARIERIQIKAVGQ